MLRKLVPTFFAALLAFVSIACLAQTNAASTEKQAEKPNDITLQEEKISGSASQSQAPQEDKTAPEKPTQPEDPMQVVRPKSYWLGLQIAPVPGFLLSQFGENEDSAGLIAVESIVPDAPAAKSGVQRGDIIVQLGETEIHVLQELVQKVADVKETEQTMTVLRKGKKLELKITPAERPDMAEMMENGKLPFDWRKLQGRMPMMTPLEMPPGMKLGPEIQFGPHSPEELKKAVEELKKGFDVLRRQEGMNLPDAQNNEPVGQFQGSGKSLAVSTHTDAAGKTTIRVRKSITSGEDTATRTWEADSIENLPEEVRGEVQQLLGKE